MIDIPCKNCGKIIEPFSLWAISEYQIEYGGCIAHRFKVGDYCSDKCVNLFYKGWRWIFRDGGTKE